MLSVVCVYNSAEIFADCLFRSLDSQTAAHELIAVDNTKRRFKSAAEALNYGGRKAKGRYIVFAHQDMVLESKTWLKDFERMLDGLPRLGIAGVAGNSKDTLCAVSNMVHDYPPCFAGHIQISGPKKVQTLDECLVAIPRRVFKKLEFDGHACDDWHMYAVDYALSAKKIGLDAYVLPAPCYHASCGASMSDKYYSTLQHLADKHRETGWIYTTVGIWDTHTPVSLQKIRIFHLSRAGVMVLMNGKPEIFYWKLRSLATQHFPRAGFSRTL
ncbi:MAG: glycosyltransferase [Candidatus Micrarchaeia archaeon]